MEPSITVKNVVPKAQVTQNAMAKSVTWDLGNWDSGSNWDETVEGKPTPGVSVKQVSFNIKVKKT